MSQVVGPATLEFHMVVDLVDHLLELGGVDTVRAHSAPPCVGWAEPLRKRGAPLFYVLIIVPSEAWGRREQGNGVKTPGNNNNMYVEAKRRALAPFEAAMEGPADAAVCVAYGDELPAAARAALAAACAGIGLDEPCFWMRRRLRAKARAKGLTKPPCVRRARACSPPSRRSYT